MWGLNFVFRVEDTLFFFFFLFFFLLLISFFLNCILLELAKMNRRFLC
jgi:hypothetical protein